MLEDERDNQDELLAVRLRKGVCAMTAPATNDGDIQNHSRRRILGTVPAAIFRSVADQP